MFVAVVSVASFLETGWLMDEREGDGDKPDIRV